VINILKCICIKADSIKAALSSIEEHPLEQLAVQELIYKFHFKDERTRNGDLLGEEDSSSCFFGLGKISPEPIYLPLIT
jgi:hypothetical protein